MKVEARRCAFCGKTKGVTFYALQRRAEGTCPDCLDEDSEPQLLAPTFAEKDPDARKEAWHYLRAALL